MIHEYDVSKKDKPVEYLIAIFRHDLIRSKYKIVHEAFTKREDKSQDAKIFRKHNSKQQQSLDVKHAVRNVW